MRKVQQHVKADKKLALAQSAPIELGTLRNLFCNKS